MTATLDKLSSYGTSFQTKVLASILTNKNFLHEIHDVVLPEFFDSTAHKWIVEETLRYFAVFNTIPTLDSISIEVKKIENDVLKVSVIEQLKIAYKAKNQDQDYVEQEFASFCKNQKLKQALLDSVVELEKGNYDEIRAIIDNAVKAGQDKNIGHEYSKDVETRYRKETRNPIPTPWETINELLQGGLGEGDLGLIFGGPGGGKSWFLVAIGAIAASLGFNVVHYTLELSESYVGLRYDSLFTQIPVDVVQSHRKEVEKAIENLPGGIIIKEFPMGTVRISALESHIKKCTDQGFKPDLIILDYVDLLKSSRKRSSERKDEIDDVYMGTKALAKKLHIPIWSASQVNRMGAQDKIIEGDKAAGSYDKLMISDFAISLSRKRKDKVNGTGRFHIMKNRYGYDGTTFPAVIDTRTGRIEISKEEFDEDEEDNNDSKPLNGRIQVFNNEEKNILKQKFYTLVNESDD